MCRACGGVVQKTSAAPLWPTLCNRTPTQSSQTRTESWTEEHFLGQFAGGWTPHPHLWQCKCHVLLGRKSPRLGSPPSHEPSGCMSLPPIINTITLRARKLFLALFLGPLEPLHQPQEQEGQDGHLYSMPSVLSTHMRMGRQALPPGAQTGRRTRNRKGEGLIESNGTNGQHCLVPAGRRG